MKNPNGYGTVVKLSGKRRNPYAVRKTKGFDARGYPIYINVGYAPTREAGLIMLAEYNKSPWDIDASKLTLDELFHLWLEKRAPKLSAGNRKALRCAYKHLEKYKTMKYSEIKAYHMQDTVDSCEYGYATQGTIKNLWKHLDDFAMEIDVIQKSYSQLVSAAQKEETSRTPFSDEEVQKLWDNQQLPAADSALFMIYTGMRITEALTLRIEKIDLKSEIPTITGGIKTEAGRNRTIPIHSKILPMVRVLAAKSQSGYLFERNGKQMKQTAYRQRWETLVKTLGMNHTPHECRHTLRSRLDSAGANKVCIDRIMGHKSEGVGEQIYTHKSIKELKEAIELVTN